MHSVALEYTKIHLLCDRGTVWLITLRGRQIIIYHSTLDIKVLGYLPSTVEKHNRYKYTELVLQNDLVSLAFD